MKISVTNLVAILAFACFLAVAVPTATLAGSGWHGAPIQPSSGTQAVQPASGEIRVEQSLGSAWSTVIRSLLSAVTLF